MARLLLLFFSVSVFACDNIFAQVPPNISTDSLHIVALNEEAKNICNSDPDSAIALSTEALRLSQEINWEFGIGKSENNLGWFNYLKGNNSVALIHFFSALKIWDLLQTQPDYDQSVVLERKSGTLGNIGVAYWTQGENEKALDYLGQAVTIDSTLENSGGIARHYGNIGNVFTELKNYGRALLYYRMALKIDQSNGNEPAVTRQLGNIGLIHYYTEEYDSALYYLSAALQRDEDAGDDLGIARHLGNIGSTYWKMGQFEKAREYFYRSLDIAKQLGDKEELRQNYYNLYMLDSATHKTLDALKNYQLFILYRDSITDEFNTKKQAEAEIRYQYNKQFLADSISNVQKLDKEKSEHDAAIAKQKLYTTGGIAGFVLMLIIAFVSFYAFRHKQKANVLIARQKLLVEEKQKEIIDSINYAKRLQEAILPNIECFNSLGKDRFLFYKPKDIVAGDFYFLEEVNGHLFVAAADSTGHGVPGAMVSVVCSNALSRVVRGLNYTDPGEILDKATDIILETFTRSNMDVKDGMDISLCAINTSSGILKWAGAHNPLWIINHQTKECRVIDANKQPVGLHDCRVPFTTHIIEAKPGEMIYLFTDGYADQFGGEKGKKFKTANLRKLLQSISEKTCDEQALAISRTFDQWKGDTEQVDDICIIGIRL